MAAPGVKFIRVRGRVVPIRDKGAGAGDSSQSGARARQPGKKPGGDRLQKKGGEYHYKGRAMDDGDWEAYGHGDASVADKYKKVSAGDRFRHAAAGAAIGAVAGKFFFGHAAIGAAVGGTVFAARTKGTRIAASKKSRSEAALKAVRAYRAGDR